MTSATRNRPSPLTFDPVAVGRAECAAREHRLLVASSSALRAYSASAGPTPPPG